MIRLSHFKTHWSISLIPYSQYFENYNADFRKSNSIQIYSTLFRLFFLCFLKLDFILAIKYLSHRPQLCIAHARLRLLAADTWAQSRVTLHEIRGGRSVLGAGFCPISFVSPRLPPFYHCSTLIYHRPTRCAIVLTKQHIIIPSVLSYGLHLWPDTWLVSE
jgi:hypothetical protein